MPRPFSQPCTLQLGQIYNLRTRTTGSRVLIRIRLGAEGLNSSSPIASSWDEHEQIRKVSWLAGEDSRGGQHTTNGGSSWSFHSGGRRWGWVGRCVI